MAKTTTKLTVARKEELLAKMALFREIGVSGNSDLMDRMEKAEEVTLRDQWDADFREDMEHKGKVCLSVPMIRPAIKQVVGHVVQNPKDIIVINERGGLRVLADVVSALMHHTMVDQDVSQQVVQWFEQATITGCSYLAALMDYDADPLNGNLEILKLNEFEVLVDPTCEVYDLSKPKIGAKFVQWQSEQDRDYVEARWPDAVEEYGIEVRQGGKQGDSFINWLIGAARGVSRFLKKDTRGSLFERDKLRYPVTHTWWIEYKKVQYFYDHRVEDMDAMVLVDPKEIQAAKDAAEAWPDTFTIKEAVCPQVNHTITLGTEVLLDHIEDEFSFLQTGQAILPIVRLCPNFNNGYASGIAEDMLGLQEYVNWIFSLGVNVLKNQPNSGWFIEDDPGNKQQWLKDHGNEDGIVINRADFGGGAEKIAPAPMPDFIPMTQMGMDMLRQNSGIRTEVPEKDDKQLSGRAILAKQQGAITGVSPIFSNFDYSLSLWGRLTSHIIRACPVYSDSEIKEIIEEERLLDPQLLSECRAAVAMSLGFELPEQPQPPDLMIAQTMQPEQLKSVKDQYERHMLDYQKLMAAVDAKAKPMAITGLIDAMRNPRRGRYNCRIALSPQALTMRARNLMEIIEVNEVLLANQQPPLSDKYIIEASDLPKKEEILAERGYK